MKGFSLNFNNIPTKTKATTQKIKFTILAVALQRLCSQFQGRFPPADICSILRSLVLTTISSWLTFLRLRFKRYFAGLSVKVYIFVIIVLQHFRLCWDWLLKQRKQLLRRGRKKENLWFMLLDNWQHSPPLSPSTTVQL